MSIILASQSPRRRALLHQIGIRDFRVLPAEADETIPEGMPPEEAVKLLSGRKAEAVVPTAAPGDIVIAADTVVALDSVILGKPADERDAKRMLSLLSGKSHRVYTGVTVRRGRESLYSLSWAEVTFRSLSTSEIVGYIATGEPMDKAGAYGIQGYGALLISGLKGDYYAVVGLPLCPLGEMLAALGVSLF